MNGERDRGAGAVGSGIGCHNAVVAQRRDKVVEGVAAGVEALPAADAEIVALRRGRAGAVEAGVQVDLSIFQSVDGGEREESGEEGEGECVDGVHFDDGRES